ATASENPSFLAIDPGARFLYAVNEVNDFGGQRTGAASSFAIDRATGKLRALNQQASAGADPCHLIVDRQRRNLLVANYTGGNVSVLPIRGDGSLRAVSDVEQHE